MSALHFLYDGATSSVTWTSRCITLPSFFRVAFVPTRVYTGHHHVSAVLADAGLDRPRNRNAPQPSIRAQFDMAQCPKSLHRKVNYFFFFSYAPFYFTGRGHCIPIDTIQTNTSAVYHENSTGVGRGEEGFCKSPKAARHCTIVGSIKGFSSLRPVPAVPRVLLPPPSQLPLLQYSGAGGTAQSAFPCRVT
jgi:hypothetical protein